MRSNLLPWNQDEYLSWENFLLIGKSTLIKKLTTMFQSFDNWSQEQIKMALTQIEWSIFNVNETLLTRWKYDTDIFNYALNKTALIIYDAYKKFYSQKQYEKLLNLDNGLDGLFSATRVICGTKTEDFNRLFSEKVSSEVKTDNTNTRTPNLTTENTGKDTNKGNATNSVMDASSDETDDPMEEVRKNKYLAGGALAETTAENINEDKSLLTGTDKNQLEGMRNTSGTRDIDKDTYYKNIGDSKTLTETNIKVQYLKDAYEATQIVQHSMKTFTQNVFAFIALPIQDAEYIPMPFPYTYGY